MLGVGGFGVTYLGEHISLGCRVAVKEYLPNEFAVREGVTVHPKSSADRDDFEWGLTRFVDGARTLTRFRHPNLVRVSLVQRYMSIHVASVDLVLYVHTPPLAHLYHPLKKSHCII